MEERLFPFTLEQVRQKKLAIKEAKEELEELKESGRWHEALAAARELASS